MRVFSRRKKKIEELAISISKAKDATRRSLTQIFATTSFLEESNHFDGVAINSDPWIRSLDFVLALGCSSFLEFTRLV